MHRPAGSDRYYEHPVSTVCVAARNIRTMFVAYSDEAISARPSSGAVGAVGAAGEEAPSVAVQESAPVPG